MRPDEVSIVLMGHHLGPTDVQSLEQKLSSQPDGYEDRLSLIGFYFKHYQCCENAGKRRIDHIVWLIRKHPDFNAILASYVCTHLLDRRAYACIKAAWQAALKRHVLNINVYCNMADFVQLHEPELALQLCEQALVIAPANVTIINRVQKLRDSLERLIANRDSINKSSEPYFVLGAVPCPGTGRLPSPRSGPSATTR